MTGLLRQGNYPGKGPQTVIHLNKQAWFNSDPPQMVLFSVGVCVKPPQQRAPKEHTHMCEPEAFLSSAVTLVDKANLCFG